MAPAHRMIFGVAQLYRWTVESRLTVVQPEIAYRLAVAVVTRHFHLFDPIGELHQALRSRKQPGPKIGSQPVTNHRYARVDGGAAQGFDRGGGKKLGFVDE